MIFNQHLDRLKEVQLVRDFMQRHRMQGGLCTQGDDSSFILYRFPYVVEFRDALIENYLEIVLVDVSSNLLLTDGSITFCSVELGHQNREILRTLDFSSHKQNNIFLSEGSMKMYGLHTVVEALDKLIPLIEARGGLSSIRDGTFDLRFDFRNCVQPMYPGLKDKYLKCINSQPET